jgi:nitronate monooxygenase
MTGGELWPKSSLLERLELVHPIIQAPMIPISMADLVVAVSQAGALGSLGSASMPAQTIAAQVSAIRARTQRAFSLNFFVHRAPVLDHTQLARWRERLASHRQALGLPEAPEQATLEAPPPFDDAMLEAVLELRPAAVSFHFGAPSAHAIAALKQADVYLLGCATTVPEALQLEAAGMDAVIAQGSEAGGHRGTFAPPFGRGEIGLMSLLPQVADAVRIPVIAAGGIADGRGIAAALTLGAAGVQLGTAFLATPEATLDPSYRRVLQEPRAAVTQLTKLYTGRPARSIVTRFMEELAAHEDDALTYPLQRAITGPLGQAALKQGNPEYHSLWAGQSAALLRQLPAAKLIETLVEETEHALAKR